MTVYVFFWFDVEDYITPASDVALGRLVDIFDRHGLKATFKMVGEKVRGLLRQGHYDILRKLQAHDIGYHTDHHSRPPSIPEYLLECDWAGGVAEFVRREQDGLATLSQAFGRVPSCYGQPGGSWAPHVYPALRQWSIPTYLDAGPWVALDGRPHRYCDVLDMLGLRGVMSIGISGGREEVNGRQGRLGELVDQFSHTGGEISLFAHECEFVTAKFWDGLNYGLGRNTPRERWVPAPLLSEHESEERYMAMDDLLAFVQELPDVQIVGASQAPVLYLDEAKGETFTLQQVVSLCANVESTITHQECDGVWLSPAEVFSLAVNLLAARVREGRWPNELPYRYVDGPVASPSAEVRAKGLPLEDVFGTCLYEDAYVRTYGHMPSQVQVGMNWLTPADFLATICAAIPRWVKGDEGDAPVVASDFLQAEYVPTHVEWAWSIFPPGFNADPLMEVGKLQAWTLKPAPLVW